MGISAQAVMSTLMRTMDGVLSVYMLLLVISEYTLWGMPTNYQQMVQVQGISMV